MLQLTCWGRRGAPVGLCMLGLAGMMRALVRSLIWFSGKVLTSQTPLPFHMAAKHLDKASKLHIYQVIQSDLLIHQMEVTQQKRPKRSQKRILLRGHDLSSRQDIRTVHCWVRTHALAILSGETFPMLALLLTRVPPLVASMVGRPALGSTRGALPCCRRQECAASSGA